VTGLDFGDALAAAPIAAAHGWPILLTSSAALPVSVSAAVRDLKPTTSLVVGTTSAVSDNVKKALPLPERVSGTTRAATTVAVAQWARAKNLKIGHIALATDANFPDALTAGPLLAMDGGFLLLTPTNSASMPAASTTFVSQNRDTILRVDLLGASNAVSDGYIPKLRGLLVR
jgi:hypothetical protein